MKRSTEPSTRPPVLGYALAFNNRSLGVHLYGSPKEILEALRRKKINIAIFADHPETTIDAEEIVKPLPHLKFSGGHHAETILELIETVRDSDTRKAAAVLERDPEALAADHSGAVVPLLAAVSAHRTQIVALFLRAGAKVDGTGDFDMTALHWAAALGDAEIATILIDAGADLQRKSWFYVTAGEIAMLNKHEAVVNLIASRHGPSSADFSVRQVLERMGLSGIAH